MTPQKPIRVITAVILILLFTATCNAAPIKEAMNEAAEYFTKQAVKIDSGQTLRLVRIVNINTFQEDETGSKIRNELAVALENQSPDYKLTLNAGKGQENDVNLTGIYDLQGETVNVKLRVFRGKEILAQYEVEYEIEKVRRKTLVAVLDLEAKSLDRSRRKAFSDIFRSALSDIDAFDLASSADIDKMNPDMIQEATGCTRDSCATIIGEQLGVDRVISTSMYKVGEGLHILSSKVMDLEEGATLISRTVEHQGDLKNISSSLQQLAIQLTGKTEALETKGSEPEIGKRTLRHATDKAAFYFTKTAVKIEPSQELHVREIVNANSKKRDDLGKRVESELFFSLERQYPDFKLFLGEGEGDDNEIQLFGTYEPEGEITILKFKILKEDEILAQFETEYDTKAHHKALVAVLDLETDKLDEIQRKAYSDIFRASLSEIAVFDIASTADVDRLDPDAIQAETGCSRDSCATIIGEQLGVDRVISSSMFSVGEDAYILSAKVMDIQDGSVLVSKTIEHFGDFASLKPSLEKLAKELTGQSNRLFAKEEFNTEYIWHGTAIAMALLSGWMAVDTASKHDDLSARNSELANLFNNAISQAELSQYRGEYEDNQEKMTSYKSNIDMYNAITVIAVIWESYLLFFSSDGEDDTTNGKTETGLLSPKLELMPFQLTQDKRTLLSLKWQW